MQIIANFDIILKNAIFGSFLHFFCDKNLEHLNVVRHNFLFKEFFDILKFEF